METNDRLGQGLQSRTGNRMRIPIFVISFNRFEALRRSIESYLRFVEYEDLVIVDRGSTYRPLHEYYRVLRANGGCPDSC